MTDPVFWIDYLITGQQRALSQVGFVRVRIGVSGRRAGSLAVEVSGVVIASAINNLGCQASEERFRTFLTVDEMELSFRLGADDALFGTDVASNKPGKDKIRRIRDIDGKGS